MGISQENNLQGVSVPESYPLDLSLGDRNRIIEWFNKEFRDVNSKDLFSDDNSYS